MLTETTGTLLAALIGAFASGLGTYWTTRRNFDLERQRYQQELQAEYDKDLRATRIDVYKPLWALTALLPRYGADKVVRFASLHDFTIALRTWYFTQGGMFLTESSKDAYFALQGGLKSVLAGKEGEQLDAEVPAGTQTEIRDLCSTMRSTLVADVGARNRSSVN